MRTSLAAICRFVKSNIMASQRKALRPLPAQERQVSMPDPMTKFAAIKAYFVKDGGTAVTIDELKQLSLEERQEVAEACAKELGVELKATK